MRLALADISPDDLFDVCIVGAGPAGITCALTLEQAGRRVALLEGGGEDYSDWSQDLYRGEVAGDPYFELDVTRLRYLGGSSNHWGGLCRPLDAIDFLPKEGFPGTGWPIRKADLDPYLERAAGLLEIPAPPPDRPLEGGALREVEFLRSPPVQFGPKFGPRLDASGSVFLVLGANLVDLETDGARITGAVAAGRDGARRTVRARVYVLATGGIENSRLLLWFNARTNGQVVKRAGTLGKYWLEHPHFSVGDVIVTGEPAFAMMHADPAYPRAYVAPTERLMREAGILNCGLRYIPLSYEGTAELITDIACVAPEWGTWAMRQLGARLICGALLHCAWEQVPRAESRVELGTERDALGMPRPRLIWRKGPRDRLTPRVVAEAFGAYMAETDNGRVRIDRWLLEDGAYPAHDEIAGHHHMGGTRMAATPEEGVVDRDCRVFGQENLYIAGSSVFPSVGHANPTMTIVQLALRLGEHLGARV